MAFFKKITNRLGILDEMLQFLLQIKWWWITPMLLILLLFVLLIVFAQGPGVDPLHER